MHKPLLSEEKNGDDESAASSDPEEHTAMMYINGKWLDQATIKEKAAKFLDWANKAITPEPTAKYHPEWNATELRVVDPFADEGVYAIIDEGANSITHSDRWMKNAVAKWAKKGFRPVLAVSSNTKFTGVGSKKSTGKWTVPIALELEESQLILPGSLWSHEMPDSNHPVLISQSTQSKLGFVKGVRAGTIIMQDYEDQKLRSRAGSRLRSLHDPHRPSH